MDVETLRMFCLSLSDDVEEKFPFQRFKAARDVLAFYIGGHMFCYFDINDLRHVTVKNYKENIPQLLEDHDCLDRPYNGNPKYWLSIDVMRAEEPLTRRLIMDSFNIVKARK